MFAYDSMLKRHSERILNSNRKNYLPKYKKNTKRKENRERKAPANKSNNHISSKITVNI